MKKRSQIRLRQLCLIVVAWLMVGLFMTVYDHLVLFTANSWGPSSLYSFRLSLFLNLSSALIGAVLGGSFLVFFVNAQYQDKPFGKTVLAVCVSYILIILVIIAVIGLVNVQIQTGKNISEPIAEKPLKPFFWIVPGLRIY